MLNGSLGKLYSFGESRRNNVVKALIALSKYFGVCEGFRLKFRNYGIKLKTPDSFRAFMRMIEKKEDFIDRVKECRKVLDRDLATFIKLSMVSGLRKNKALKSFNKIITLSQSGRLDKYYNFELQALNTSGSKKVY